MPDDRLAAVLDRLAARYPDATYELNWETPFQLLVATVLAAQATDERINRLTPALFARFPDAHALAAATQEEVEPLVRDSGYFRQKAERIRELARLLVERHGGEVPPRMEDLVKLPGVARKTANVVLNVAFGQPSGIIVDTHVLRVAPRLGLTTETRPERVEADLMRQVPRERWTHFGPAMVLHGRYTCMHHSPRCGDCVLADLCPRVGVGGSPVATARPAPVTTTIRPDEDDTVDQSQLPAGWREALAAEFREPYWPKLQAFLADERRDHQVFPPEADVFNALKLTPLDEVRVFLLGQDPYHDDGQAHGLCFSVRPGVTPPPSLRNMFKELRDDLGVPAPKHGCLEAWARQGVLLLNAVLTVRAHTPNSHKDKGWEQFTDAVIRAVNDRTGHVVFLLWGAYAQKKLKLIDASRHTVIQSAHPSPLSAKNGFFGSKPYSRVNEALRAHGQPVIDWCLPEM
jgi:uracil-DNA glycosylase